MKNIYLILSIFFLNQISFSQNMWMYTNTPSQIQNLTTIKFQNTLTGYIGGFQSTNVVIYKTTDAGITWSTQPICQFSATETNTMDFDFIDVGNGNLRFFISVDNALKKFENGNVTDILTRTNKNLHNKVKVSPNNTIFWLYSGLAGTSGLGPYYNISIYKSTNGGLNWSAPVYNHLNSPNSELAYLIDIDASTSDSALL